MAFQPLRGLGLALALSLAAGTALAQQRVIRIVVPYGPGAVQDTIARTFNNELACCWVRR